MTATTRRTGSTRRAALRTAVAAAALSPVVYVRDGWAQGKEIAIGVWGGAQGDFIKKNVLPKFENDLGCKVLAEEGFTLANVSKLRATKANPKYTVMFVDDLAIPICKSEDLITALPRDKMPNLANLYPRFLYEEGFGTGLGVSLGGMFYNTAVKPPQSYAELWDPRYKGKLKLNSPKNTPSVFFLIAAAAVVTGKPFKEAQYEIDKAWEKIAQIKPNVQNVFESGIQAALEVAQGQADVGGIEYSKYIYPYTAKQAPVDMAFMKEGSFAGTNCQVLVKNGPNQDLGIAFMNRMLDPVVQKALAEFALIAPPVAGIEFSAATLKWIPYPDRKMDELGLFTPDWGHINSRRGAWTEKMNQIFSA